MSLPSSGTRIYLSGHLGTVRYVGSVHGTQGTWLGVEWDEPLRGKHDGVKDDKRYFTCLVPNSGSFIRPTAHIDYGVSFLSALASKYIEMPLASASFPSGKETVTLGSSHGTIEVEAVGLDKVRSKLAQLERLKEVSLDGQHVSQAEDKGVIIQRCPNIMGLDLSRNLLASWDIVALITSELGLLERLALNSNRLQESTNHPLLSIAFLSLQELQLNATLVSWPSINHLLRFLPKLKTLEVGYNRLEKLSRCDDPSHRSTVELLNLDSNSLCDWSNICESLASFTSLTRLVLASNHLSSIPSLPISHEQSPVKQLKFLSLSSNAISQWSSIDNLTRWCPNLEGLNTRECTFTEGRNSRQFIIARMASLTTLDGAAISSKERTDSEIFYLSHITQHGPGGADERAKYYGRWAELVAKYGHIDEPTDAQRREQQGDKLSNRLLHINIYLHPNNHPTNPTQPETPLITLPALMTMPIRMFRLKLIKTLKGQSFSSVTNANLKLYLRMPDNSLSPLSMDQHDTRELEWCGVEEGSDIFVKF